MKESQILENWSLGKYSPGFSSVQPSLLIFCSWITDQEALHSTRDVPFLSILELAAQQWCKKWFQIQSLGTGSLSKTSTEDITAREILLVFQRPSCSSSTGNLPANVLLGFPIIILLPVCSKDKMLLSTVRSKVVFLAWWSSKEEVWLCQLCMSNTMGLIPAFFFFPGIKSQGWLQKKPTMLNHEQQDMQLNPHVPWEWSQPSQPLWKRLQWWLASIPWQKQTLLLPWWHHSSSWHSEMWPGDKSVWNWAQELYWNIPALRCLDSWAMPALHRHWFLSQRRGKVCTRCNFPSLMNFSLLNHPMWNQTGEPGVCFQCTK